MPSANFQGRWPTVLWHKTLIKIYLVIFIGLTIYVVWIRNQKPYDFALNIKSLKQANVVQSNLRLNQITAKHESNKVSQETERGITSSNGKDMKYILIWTSQRLEPLSFFSSGQKAFIANNCTYTNCYVTTNRTFFGNNISKFDALAFNGRNMLNRNINRNELPQIRSQHQKYIFFNMESADNDPICSKVLDGFFNWSSTYRLDSDIPYTYILIRDSKGTQVGPQRNMKWLEKMNDVDENVVRRLQNKTKAAAWFVSHCHPRGGRRKFIEKLQRALDKYGLKVDEFGACSFLKCPKSQVCYNKLERDYFFYMALENTLDEDYVTEKLLTALNHYTIPIVYGGANYSRFLPPSSYLNAQEQTPEKLAAIMNRLIKSPKEYRQYFKWRNHYAYSDPGTTENVCAVCAALNNKTMVDKTTVYDNFRKYWHPNFTERCTQNIRGT